MSIAFNFMNPNVAATPAPAPEKSASKDADPKKAESAKPANWGPAKPIIKPEPGTPATPAAEAAEPAAKAPGAVPKNWGPAKTAAEVAVSAAKAPEAALKNSAFVFVKPHAVTPKANAMVKDGLEKQGLVITSEGDLTSEVIDEKKLIDQHYYAIASKATILKPKELNVPQDKFKSKFGLEWEDALAKGIVFNALDACQEFGCNADELSKAWGDSKKQDQLVKFGGGFYCGLVTMKEKQLYVFNAFFMSMRSAFTAPGKSIHYYTVEWDPAKLSWEDFRGKLLGPTDPAEAPKDSLRGQMLERWEELGLLGKPNTGDNGVHASASPFEGVAERLNWLGVQCKADSYCKALLDAGVKEETINSWSVDPQVKIDASGKKGSLFDALEDMDAKACAEKCKALQAMQ
jgi:nucleoside diphosphate kinase